MARTLTNGLHKVEIIEKENGSEVTFFEMMGGRWVSFGTELYSKELTDEIEL